jgi:hypothetical protein
MKPKCELPVLKHENIIVNDDQKKAQLFNDLFCPMFTTDNGSTLVNSSESNSSLDAIVFDVVDVYHSLKFLDSKNSVGPDGFFNFFLRKFSLVLALPLCSIFKKSIQLGQLPDIWKTANVIPVFKKKAPNP